jgi:predicted nuclease of predicted toxin-antitoxin system
VRVLLDESLPRDLARHLTGHEVSTVQRRGWAGLKNGELLRVARDAGFAVLVTTDRNMEHQQRIGRSGLALVVLRARSTRLVDLLPLVPRLLEVLPQVEAGQVTHVAG